MIFEKPIGQVTADDIRSLVANKVREGTMLDYKLELPGSSNDDKKEFLGDICSFANSNGGLIIYGIEEERGPENKHTGLPEFIPGLANFNADAEQLRLNQMIRDSLDPRIPGVELQPVEGFEQGPVLLIRIPRSFLIPHVVTFRDSFRFYGRTSCGKHPLDVREVTSLVLQSSAIPQRLKNFRAERLMKIIARQTPVPILGNPTTVLHIVPLSVFAGTHAFDVASLSSPLEGLWPSALASCGTRFNLDGLLIASSAKTEPAVCYTQVFRNGVIEIVTAREDWFLKDETKTKYIPSVAYERYTIGDIKKAVDFMLKQSIPPPLIVFPNILGVSDAVLITRANEAGIHNKYVFGEDSILLPDVTISDYTQDIEKALQPAFDFLWQAGGFPRSDSYQPDGKWKPRYQMFPS